MIRFTSYIDENGKKRLKNSDEWLKRKDEENKKREIQNKILSKKRHHNYWLEEWLDKRKTEKLDRYIECLRQTIPKERWNEKLIRRFFSKVDITDDLECWNWMACVHVSGYGMFSRGYKSIVSHRISYMIINGNIPDDMLVLHSCDNKRCVNPNHLFIGSQQDNMTDMIEKGRSLLGKSKNSKFNWIQICEIRKDYNEGKITIYKLSKKYGVCHESIRAIIKNKRWRDDEYQKFLDEENQRLIDKIRISKK